MGEDREKEERDDNRKDIFWGVEEDEVVDYLLGVYCRFHSFLCICFKQKRSMSEIGLGFPGVFRQWITFPCSQVPAVFAVATVSYDPINFVLFFGINHVRRRLEEVRSMCVGFLIREKKGGVEDIMNFPCGR